jgi:hypothetical protein
MCGCCCDVKKNRDVEKRQSVKASTDRAVGYGYGSGFIVFIEFERL